VTTVALVMPKVTPLIVNTLALNAWTGPHRITVPTGTVTGTVGAEVIVTTVAVEVTAVEVTAAANALTQTGVLAVPPRVKPEGQVDVVVSGTPLHVAVLLPGTVTSWVAPNAEHTPPRTVACDEVMAAAAVKVKVHVTDVPVVLLNA